MILSILWIFLVFAAFVCSFLFGTGAAVSSAAMEGAQNGLQITLSIAGALCLWTGLAKVMEASALSSVLSRLFRPVLGRIFPESFRDDTVSGLICSNFTANLLGLGNAATPMGIAAIGAMQKQSETKSATDEMCRLIVLNTASIQLIPTTVAAVRAGLGAENAFDILPAVWVTSLLSASSGLLAAWVMGKRRG